MLVPSIKQGQKCVKWHRQIESHSCHKIFCIWLKEVKNVPMRVLVFTQYIRKVKIQSNGNKVVSTSRFFFFLFFFFQHTEQITSLCTVKLLKKTHKLSTYYRQHKLHPTQVAFLCITCDYYRIFTLYFCFSNQCHTSKWCVL